MRLNYRHRPYHAIRPHSFSIVESAGAEPGTRRALIDEAIAWCHANLKKKHPTRLRCHNWRYRPDIMRFEIYDDDDAFAFRMRWS